MMGVEMYSAQNGNLKNTVIVVNMVSAIHYLECISAIFHAALRKMCSSLCVLLGYSDLHDGKRNIFIKHTSPSG